MRYLPLTKKHLKHNKLHDNKTLNLAFFISLCLLLLLASVDPTLICQQKKDPGLCLAYFPRYYFNATARKCEKFIYGGCGGNLNKFSTYQECRKTCDGKKKVRGMFRTLWNIYDGMFSKIVNGKLATIFAEISIIGF